MSGSDSMTVPKVAGVVIRWLNQPSAGPVVDCERDRTCRDTNLPIAAYVWGVASRKAGDPAQFESALAVNLLIFVELSPKVRIPLSEKDIHRIKIQSEASLRRGSWLGLSILALVADTLSIRIVV